MLQTVGWDLIIASVLIAMFLGSGWLYDLIVGEANPLVRKVNRLAVYLKGPHANEFWAVLSQKYGRAITKAEDLSRKELLEVDAIYGRQMIAFDPSKVRTK